MPLSQRPSPVTLFAFTEIDKPGEAIPTVNLMECAPASGQELFGPVRPERQSKVAMTEEFWPVANVQNCVEPSLLGTQPHGGRSMPPQPVVCAQHWVPRNANDSTRNADIRLNMIKPPVVSPAPSFDGDNRRSGNGRVR